MEQDKSIDEVKDGHFRCTRLNPVSTSACYDLPVSDAIDEHRIVSSSVTRIADRCSASIRLNMGPDTCTSILAVLPIGAIAAYIVPRATRHRTRVGKFASGLNPEEKEGSRQYGCCSPLRSPQLWHCIAPDCHAMCHCLSPDHPRFPWKRDITAVSYCLGQR